MSSSSQNVRYRMVSTKDDLIDTEINQAQADNGSEEPDDRDADLAQKSKFLDLFSRKTWVKTSKPSWSDQLTR
jgi:hypothetical protein